MITSYYRDYSSYISAKILGVQIGNCVGPLWGGLLFNALGYTGIFLVQSATTFLGGLLVCYFRKHEKANPLIQIQQPDSLGTWRLFKVRVRVLQ